MEDIVSFLKRSVLDANKNAVDKDYKPKTKDEMARDFKEKRKETRGTLLLHKRNIGVLSPFTPEPVRRKSSAKKAVTAPPSNRLELLKKWKEEKERRKAEEKRKAKPIFKVCRVIESVGLPNLDSVNKQIKGKTSKSNFAPSNHKFVAPKNIKPINFEVGKLASQKQLAAAQKNTRSSAKTNQTKPPVKNVGQKNLVRQNAIDLNFPKEPAKSTPKKPFVIRRTRQTLKSTHQPVASSKTVPSTSKAIPEVLNPLTPEHETEREVLYSDDEISVRTPSRVSYARRLRLATPGTTLGSTQEASYSSSQEVNLRTPGRSGKSVGEISSIGRTVQETTPVLQQITQKSPTYISPFVTISRGKDSARKEYRQRQSTGGTYFPSSGRAELNSTNPIAAAEYFTKILEVEISKTQGVCAKWEAYKSDDLPEEAHNLINVVLGQSNLLLTKKFGQFLSLIEECRSCQYKEKPITCQDLHGFWDLVCIQVADLEKRFENLDRLRESNWVEVVPDQKAVPKQGRSRPKKQAASSTGVKDFLRSARCKKKQTEEFPGGGSSLGIVEAGPSSLNLPVSKRSSESTPSRKLIILPSSSASRRSLRVSLLGGQARKSRQSSSPGLTMMRISQAIKTGDGITPSKSILKTDASRSDKRATKSVLFRDQFEDDSLEAPKEDKENRDSGNVSYMMPVKTRKSKRLATRTDS